MSLIVLPVLWSYSIKGNNSLFSSTNKDLANSIINQYPSLEIKSVHLDTSNLDSIKHI